MADTAKKYGGIGALVVVAVLAVGAVIYFSEHAPAPPPAPAAPVAASGPQKPVFDVVRVDAQGNTVLAGRAAPGAIVTIKSGDKVIGTATADAQGAFVLLPASPLAPGAQAITLSETLPNGTVVPGDATASIDVPAGTGQALAVLSGPNGSTVLSGQGPRPGTLGMGTVDYDANGHAIFSGTGPAGAKIKLSLNGAKIGDVTAGADGRWTLTGTVPKAGGTITLNAVNANGSVLPPVSAPFALETLPNALAAGHIVITPGDNLWVISRHVYGQGNLYTLIYNANANQIRNPNLIYPGQAFALPKPKG
ncbi:MAG: Ig-like domain-containing protein [Acidocella sp.]|nr:Ig-like domain-containing protein [Acidocella sp.]